MFTRSKRPPTIAIVKVSSTFMKNFQRARRTEGLEEIIFEEVALRMCGVDSPEVVGDDVENA